MIKVIFYRLLHLPAKDLHCATVNNVSQQCILCFSIFPLQHIQMQVWFVYQRKKMIHVCGCGCGPI